MSNQPTPREEQVIALQESLARLESSLSRIEARVASLEEAQGRCAPSTVPQTVTTAPAPRQQSSTTAAETEDYVEEVSLSGAITAAGANIGPALIGGILLVLAGGFVLRALTESGVLPRLAGTLVGLVYAAVWAILCHILGVRGRRPEATASAIAAVLVAVPLIWESTARFSTLSPWVAGALLIATAALVLPIAERHRLALASAAAVLGIGCASLALPFGGRTLEPFALTLAVLGIAAVWVGPGRGGPLPWVAYGFCDFGLLLLLLDCLSERAIARPAPTTAIVGGFFLLTMIILVAGSKRTGEAGAHRIFQGTIATLLGYGGALLVARKYLPEIESSLAATGLAIGIGGYTFLLFAFRWSRGHRWPFLLYSSLSLAIAAMSVSALCSSAWPFVAFALILATLSVTLDRVSPGLHAAFSVLFAVIAGGMGEMIRQAFVSPPNAVSLATSTGGLAETFRQSLVTLDIAHLSQVHFQAAATLIAAWFCALLPLKVDSPLWPSWLPRLGRAMVVLLALLGTGAMIVLLAAPSIFQDRANLDPGYLAALRTGVLAILVITAAAASRLNRLSPARWLLWPLLGLIALKLLVEDFPHGRAISLAPALLVYGVALIFAPLLARRSRQSE